MDKQDFGYIANCSHLDTNEGRGLDIIELQDGRVLAISEMEVVLYESMSDALAGRHSLDIPMIPL
jgi:hypothetical protein